MYVFILCVGYTYRISGNLGFFVATANSCCHNIRQIRISLCLYELVNSPFHPWQSSSKCIDQWTTTLVDVGQCVDRQITTAIEIQLRNSTHTGYS